MKEKIIKISKEKRIFVPILVYLLLLPCILYIYSGSPPETEIQTYKGIWMPSIGNFPNMQSMAFDFSRMKEDGMNTVQFGPVYYSFMGRVYPVPWTKALTIAYIQAAHRSGLEVFIVPELSYIVKLQHLFGSPQSIPKEAHKEVQEQYDAFVLEWAEIAERYGVELFSPLNEPEVKFGPGASSSWGQKILPKIKKIYRGKVIWRGAFHDDWESHHANFSGYDYLGFSIAPFEELEKYPQIVDSSIKTVTAFAKRDGVEEVMISEFWVPSPSDGFNYTDEENTRAHEIVLERAKGKVMGFFVCDAPGSGLFGPPFKGTKIEEVIKRYYLEMLP